MTSWPARAGNPGLGGAVGLWVLFGWACASGPRPAGDGGCPLMPEAERSSTVSVGVLGPFDPGRTPRASTDTERLVFGQVYETLVRAACGDRPEPGLALSWSTDPARRVWTFELDPRRRFSDGTPLTPVGVANSWRATARSAQGGEAPLPWDEPWFWLDPDSVSVTGDRLRVALRVPVSGPGFFAHPVLAILGPRSPEGWPVGTGPFRFGLESGGVALIPNPRHPDPPGAETRILLRSRPTESGRDPRDVLEERPDLAVVRDAELVEYARGLGYRAVPLRFDLLYALAAPIPQMPPAPADDYRPRLPGVLGDLVGAEAREFGYEGTAGCPPVVRFPGDPVPLENRPVSMLVALDPVLAAGQPRILAERLVALTGFGDGPALPGFRAGEYRSVLRPPGDANGGFLWTTGGDRLLIPFRRSQAGPCLPGEVLDPDGPLAAWGIRWLLPLVRSRAVLLVREDVGGVTVDANGVPLLSGVGRIGEAAR